jgi:hypothetical protein
MFATAARLWKHSDLFSTKHMKSVIQHLITVVILETEDMYDYTSSLQNNGQSIYGPIPNIKEQHHFVLLSEQVIICFIYIMSDF